MSTTEVGHPIVVLVSANAEWVPVKELLKPARVERTPYGECLTHAIGNQEILFFHGGWGKIAAAASTEYVVNRWHPEILINLGTCGGIEGRAQRGEKLLVTRAVTYDVHEAIGDSSQAIDWYTTDIDLTWLDDSFPIEVRRTLLVSGDRDLVPSQVSELVDRFDAVAADWESSAIAWVAHRRSVRLIIIRAISDLVNTQTGEMIGSLAGFESAATNVMRLLLDDLTVLIPYVLGRCVIDERT